MGTFLDNAGLTHYDAKLKAIVGGSLTLSGRTVKLISVSGVEIGTVTIPETVYKPATGTTAGLMSPADFKKLEGISAGATKVADSSINGNILINGSESVVYTHPSVKQAYATGFYKVTIDANGHVTAAVAVGKADITALGIPGQDTTYKPATANTEGLMTGAQFTKINGIATGAQVNVIEKVSVNGASLPISSKGVNIDLTGYALKADVVGGVRYKGEVDAFTDLPTGAAQGDMYNVKTAWADPDGEEHAAGTNCVWSGTKWDPMTSALAVASIPNTEIDKLFA